MLDEHNTMLPEQIHSSRIKFEHTVPTIPNSSAIIKYVSPIPLCDTVPYAAFIIVLLLITEKSTSNEVMLTISSAIVEVVAVVRKVMLATNKNTKKKQNAMNAKKKKNITIMPGICTTTVTITTY